MCRDVLGSGTWRDDGDGGDQHFSSLGRSLCVMRCAAVRSWGNQSLARGDPDVHARIGTGTRSPPALGPMPVYARQGTPNTLVSSSVTIGVWWWLIARWNPGVAVVWKHRMKVWSYGEWLPDRVFGQNSPKGSPWFNFVNNPQRAVAERNYLVNPGEYMSRSFPIPPIRYNPSLIRK